MKNLKLVSPQAQCKWIWLDKPHPEYDVYQITLMLPVKSKEAKSWMRDIDSWVDEEVKSSGKKPSEHLPYKEDGDNILFKFKQKSSFKDSNGERKNIKILVVDSDLKPCKVQLGWGSKVKVSYSPIPYTVNGKSGVTLYFNSVQVLDLVEYDSAVSTGFEKEEGGYSAPDPQGELPFDTESDDDDDDDF
tara:strand:+ start:1212 stop:1778 length:567 start_codon:yes stop_codon:yes gene_type:complete